MPELPEVETTRRGIAPALLGRGAQHPHGDAQLVGQSGQPQPGTDRRGGDDVVAAGVTDTGECVIFGAHGDHQRA